jgi:two-component SAPR family response regulator
MYYAHSRLLIMEVKIVKVLLVDDEKTSLMITRRIISGIPDVEIVGSFQNTKEAFLYIKNNKVDIALIDINMPNENGLDFARRVTLEVKDIAIFFLTGHKEFALDAYDLHAFDYILKPLTKKKMENSIQLACEKLVFLQSTKRMGDTTKLFVNTLGELDVRGANNETVHFTSSKSSELLCYLLLKKGRAVSKWKIIEDLFGGMLPRNAETYLNTTIYKLRNSLEPYGIRTAIVSNGESYRIETKDIYIDFIDFENKVTAYRNIQTNNLEDILETEKLFCGELFEERDYSWSLAEKERMSELYLSFAKKIAWYLLDNGLLTAALPIAKKIIKINEFDEETNCILMRMYASRRDKELLERHFILYSNMLNNELGIKPGDYMIKLYNELIRTFR